MWVQSSSWTFLFWCDVICTKVLRVSFAIFFLCVCVTCATVKEYFDHFSQMDLSVKVLLVVVCIGNMPLIWKL